MRHKHIGRDKVVALAVVERAIHATAPHVTISDTGWNFDIDTYCFRLCDQRGKRGRLVLGSALLQDLSENPRAAHSDYTKWLMAALHAKIDLALETAGLTA